MFGTGDAVIARLSDMGKAVAMFSVSVLLSLHTFKTLSYILMFLSLSTPLRKTGENIM